MRSPWTTVRWVMIAAAVVPGQRGFGQSSVPPEVMEVVNRFNALDRPKGPRWPIVDRPGDERPEFSTAAIERGEADERGIGRMEADATDGVEVTATVERAELQPLQPLRTLAVVKNVSRSRWRIAREGSNPYLMARVRVFDTRGKLLPPTRFYQVNGRTMNEVGGGANIFAGTGLDPGDSLHLDLIPNLLYDMTMPGEYWVLVEFKIESPGAYGVLKGTGMARAKPIKVKVVPDPTKFAVPFKQGMIPP